MQYFKISFLLMIAAVSLTSQQVFSQSKNDRNRPDNKSSLDFVHELWNAKLEPYVDGYFDPIMMA
jgi:hypothetical protein